MSDADPVTYREDVLTIMAVLGDTREGLRQVNRLLEDNGEEEEEADS